MINTKDGGGLCITPKLKIYGDNYSREGYYRVTEV